MTTEKKEGEESDAVKKEELARQERRKILFKSLGLKTVENPINREVAEDTFDAILEKYRIKFSNIVIENGQDAAETCRNRFIQAIEEGRMSVELIDGKGFCITQYTFSKDKIVYREYNQKAALASVKGKTGQDRIYLLMGKLSGGSDELFSNTKMFNGEDLRLVEEISNIFFW